MVTIVKKTIMISIIIVNNCVCSSNRCKPVPLTHDRLIPLFQRKFNFVSISTQRIDNYIELCPGITLCRPVFAELPTKQRVARGFIMCLRSEAVYPLLIVVRRDVVEYDNLIEMGPRPAAKTADLNNRQMRL